MASGVWAEFVEDGWGLWFSGFCVLVWISLIMFNEFGLVWFVSWFVALSGWWVGLLHWCFLVQLKGLSCYGCDMEIWYCHVTLHGEPIDMIHDLRFRLSK